MSAGDKATLFSQCAAFPDDQSINRDSCYFRLIIGRTPNVKSCEKINDQGMRNSCYYSSAGRTTNASLCDKIDLGVSPYKQQCLAEVTQDASLCSRKYDDPANNFRDNRFEENCYKVLRAKPGPPASRPSKSPAH